ncbi:MAG: MBL fold metallo-hydrolase [Candidatus Riflebacteria bacterium]|nr:MBL fold metallo-hydrolase [Candidatus Riflebacteria bacterium]
MKRSIKHNSISFLMMSLCLFSMVSMVWGSSPIKGNQAPGFFRLMVGEVEVTALLDGSISFEPAILRNTTPLLIKMLWDRAGILSAEAPASVNAFLINTGKKLILIDTGNGNGSGSESSSLLENLRESGYQAAEIDAVLLTHAHGDHIGGLLNRNGERSFPNAVVFLSRAENDFWLSAENAAKVRPEKRKSFARVRAIAAAYQKFDAWKTFEPGTELFPDLKAEAAYGHTIGHTVYLLSSGRQEIMFVGDCIHNAAAQFPRPSIGVRFDVDITRAIETRIALFARIAREHLLMAGAHLAFPGIGRIRAEGRGFVWLPVTFGPVKTGK